MLGQAQVLKNNHECAYSLHTPSSLICWSLHEMNVCDAARCNPGKFFLSLHTRLVPSLGAFI